MSSEEGDSWKPIYMMKLLLVLVLATSAAAFYIPSPPYRKTRHPTSSCQLSMSTVVVFGGTGKTGAECVYQALEAGNKVVVLARSPEKMIYPEGSG